MTLVTVRPAVVVAMVTVVVAAASLLGAPTSPGSVSRGAGLSSVVLKASQVGPGYRLKMREDSHCVQLCVTLDLCGFDFTSEADRTARLQVDYVKSRKELGLSNEVVRYRPGGTALAIRELNRAVTTCPRGPVASTVAGVGPLTYRIHRFTASHLLPGAVALRMTVSGTAKGHHFKVKTVAIYQVHGLLLSGVYASVLAGSDVTPALNFAVHAARASAANLSRS